MRTVSLLAALLACLATAACQRPAYETRRPWADEPGLEQITMAGTTMPGRWLQREPATQILALGDVVAGELLIAAAVEGPPGAQASIRWSRPEGEPSCDIAGDSARWQFCRLAVPRDQHDAALEIKIAGPPGVRLALSSPLLRSGRARARPPLFVILTDTLRFDCLHTYVPAIDLGERLDQFARDGIVFEHAYSSSSWTKTAVATLLTGLDASTHGVLDRTDILAPRFDGLPQALQRAGYRTRAWSTNPNILPMWGFAAGFDVFTDLGAFDWTTRKVGAGEVFAAVRGALDEPSAAPGFFYIHLMEPHQPYRPGADDLAAITTDPSLAKSFPGAPLPPGDEAVEKLRAAVRRSYPRYLAEIRGMDREIGAFIDELRRRGLYEQALVLVVADHGEEFLDHDGSSHGHTLYEEVLRVPAILKLPGKALAGTRIRGEVGLVDLSPTLLGALGAGSLRDADGRDLWDGSKGNVRDESAAQSAVLHLDRAHMAAIVDDWHKLIVGHRAADQFFDLRADPHERHDLLPGADAQAGQLRTLLDARIARREAGWHVRLCGGDPTVELKLRFLAEGGVRASMMEDDDALTTSTSGTSAVTAGGTYEITSHLGPRQVQREVFGKIRRETEPDEDEILAAPESDVVALRSLSPVPLRWSAGTRDERKTSAEIRVRRDDPDVAVRPTDVVGCRGSTATDEVRPAPPSPDRRPYVRVWYVAPAERKSEADVDPAVKERLRALGYGHP